MFASRITDSTTNAVAVVVYFTHDKNVASLMMLIALFKVCRETHMLGFVVVTAFFPSVPISISFRSLFASTQIPFDVQRGSVAVSILTLRVLQRYRV